MKKKIVAVILAVVMMFTIAMPAFAADDGNEESGFDIQQIINSEFVQTILGEVMNLDDTWELVGFVMDLIAKFGDKEGLKQQLSQLTSDQIAEVAKVIVKKVNELRKDLTDMQELALSTKLTDVLKNFIGSGKPDYQTTLPDRDLTWSETVMGDINDDGNVNSTDARLVLRRAARLIKFTAEQEKRADINGDGQITSGDARLILRVGARLITMDEAMGRR